jgi:hypothetical protein
MDKIQILQLLCNIITLILCIIITLKVHAKYYTENYLVDISGGFAPPCNNCGDCVSYY